MNRAEEILKESTFHTLNIIEGSPLHEAVIKAMKEYAKECIEKSLEKASQDAIVDYENKVVEESIDNEENIILL